MAVIITEQELKQIIQAGDCVKDGNPDDAEGIKYDFKFGNKFLKAYFSVPRNYEDRRVKKAAGGICG